MKEKLENMDYNIRNVCNDISNGILVFNKTMCLAAKFIDDNGTLKDGVLSVDYRKPIKDKEENRDQLEMKDEEIEEEEKSEEKEEKMVAEVGKGNKKRKRVYLLNRFKKIWSRKKNKKSKKKF